MNTEDIKKEIEKMEMELNELTSQITEEDIKNATEEEKIKFLKIITEIKSKIEILKNI